MYKKIGEVFKFIRNGANIKQGVEGGYPITRIETIANGYIDKDRMGYAGINDFGKYINYLLKEGDILMSHINSEKHLGKTAIYEKCCESIIHGMNLLCFRPYENMLYSKYAFYYFNSCNFKRQIPRITKKSVNQASFSIADIKNLNILVPPLLIQKKIAQTLDKAQELIDKRKEQIKKLDEFIQSVFLDMFGELEGEKVALSDVCTINPQKKEIDSCDENLKVTFLPMTNVSEKGQLDLSEIKTIREVKKGFTYFKEGDVLFAKITPCMENGKGAVAKKLENNIGFGSTEFHVLRPKKKVISEWVYRLTKLNNFRKFAANNMTGSAGQKRVPKQFFDKYKIVVPPLELQNEFASIVQKTEAQKDLLQKSLTEMENNFNSLMQKAFKGELFN